MSEKYPSTQDHCEPGEYEIRIKGHLDKKWADRFEGLAITLEEDGTTLLAGLVVDQAALHGLLKKVRDLGMPLVSVSQVQSYRFTKEMGMKMVKASPHGADRKTAAIVGVLFILGTIPALLSLPLMVNTVNAPDHLTAISTNAGQMIVFTAIKFIMGLACAGIGLALYPILKKYNEGLAIGAAGFRLIEGMTSVVGALLYVFLLALSREFVQAGAPAASYFQTADAVINAGIGWLRDAAMLLTFGIGALMYYIVFYQYRLVPRWLTVWGLVGIILTILGALLVMFHLLPPFGTIQVILNLPILPQELVLAVWLIAKGFDPSAVASGTASVDTH